MLLICKYMSDYGQNGMPHHVNVITLHIVLHLILRAPLTCKGVPSDKQWMILSEWGYNAPNSGCATLCFLQRTWKHVHGLSINYCWTVKSYQKYRFIWIKFCMPAKNDFDFGGKLFSLLKAWELLILLQYAFNI